MFPTPDNDEDERAACAEINITACGDRRTLEALYLELCKLAKQEGLKVAFRLGKSKLDRES